MKQVLTDIVKSIVDNPDEVVVLEKVSGDMSILELSVAKEDMGKVIGRQGRVAKCIRTVMRAAAAKENKRVIVDIVQAYAPLSGSRPPQFPARDQGRAALCLLVRQPRVFGGCAHLLSRRGGYAPAAGRTLPALDPLADL